MAGRAPKECSPDEVEFTVHWSEDDEHGIGALTGSLVARNVSRRTWRIGGKPQIRLIAAGSRRKVVRADHIVTAEGRIPNWQIVEPGHAAYARVSVSFWDGTPLADHVIVVWPGGDKSASIDGPHQPTAPNVKMAMMTSSGWFRPYEED